MPEDSPSIYTIMAERVANAVLGKINALIGSHNTNEQAHQDIRGDIPSYTSELNNDSGFITSSSLSNYLQQSDVKDNLTSTDTNKPLSAKQGKELKTLVDGKEDVYNKVTSWSNTPSDDNYPSEKLVKDSLNSKVSSNDLVSGLQNIGAYTIHTVYNVNGSTSAYDISSGLLYTQTSSVFFFVKNNIGDNEANATLKYYPNGNNIPIMDTFSTNYSPIQQGVWKKDTWALFFCNGNSIVQLKCIFYDGVDINKIKNILGMENLTYYVVSSVSKDSKRVTLKVNDNRIYNGNSFYLKVPYYETSTDVKVTINNSSSNSSSLIKQGSDYVTESQVNGHLLKLRFDSGSFQVLEIYDNDKLIPLFSDLSTVATTGSYNDLSNKPTIPTVPTNISSFNNDSGYLTAHQDITGKEDKSNKVTSLSSSSTDTEYPSAKAVFDSLSSVPSASSVTPSADTTNGSVGDGTTWARSNHTHPKSSLYAEASHTHSQYLTEHQSLSNYYNKSETNNYDVDFILGTQTASTSAWTGTTDVISSLREGTTIFYKLPYASTSTSVTLNLTLKGGGTTGAKNVFYKNTTRVTTHFGVGQVVGLTYDGTAWYVISPSDNNSNNDNNYGGIQFKAGEALTTQTICCAKDNGQYYKVANRVVLDIRYPLIMTSSAVASGTTTNAMYRTWYGVNIANTKSMTLTNGSQLFLEGTAYSNGKFTISSNVVTHTLTNGRYYIKVGTALSTTQIRFISDMTVYYYNGTTLKPAIKKEQIVDFPTIPSASSVTPSADTTSGSVGNGTTWARSDHTHPKSSLYADITELEGIRNEIDSLNTSITNLVQIQYVESGVKSINNGANISVQHTVTACPSGYSWLWVQKESFRATQTDIHLNGTKLSYKLYNHSGANSSACYVWGWLVFYPSSWNI